MKSKGFTLIELLAVILILGIIALIAIPTVSKITRSAKKSAFETTVTNLVDSIEDNCLMEQLESDHITSTYTLTNGVVSPTLNLKGKLPKSGTITVNDNCRVSFNDLTDGDFTASKEVVNDKIEVVEGVISIPDTYEDTLLNGAAPELSAGMIPISWDGSKWIKADTNEKWYDYITKKWANVVLVNDASRSTYQNANPGVTINEADVLAYLVWVPRYKYKLFNVESAEVPVQTIEVVFENNGTTKSNGSTNGTWLTHPAFTFGAEELNGIWVGKFEMTGTAASPTVKPGLTSLRNQNMKSQFDIMQKFSNTTTYGLTSANDAHIMKNMEWGAVAYLTQSVYGKNAEIWMNPSSNFITGCAGANVYVAGVSGCPFAYTTSNGQQASTTGNIYGIYDMSGGSWELVMGAMYNSGNTTIKLASSGFTQATIDSAAMSKYLDKYNYSTEYTGQASYARRHLGDAIGETIGWYDDFNAFVYSSYSWLGRGGGPSISNWCGAFHFDNTPGVADSNSSSRLTMIGAQ